MARFGSQSVVPPTASQFRWTYNPGRGFIVGKATHRRTASHALLALVLIALSACTASAIEPSSPAGTVSTADAIEPAQSTASAGGPKTPDATEGPDGTSTTATATSLPPHDPATFESLSRINTILDFASSFTAHGTALWEQSVPGVEDVRITSTIDGTAQPALWVAPRGDRDRPLLVILHSWSAPYDQHAGIPYAMFAQENGWAAIAPQYRGVNDHAEAIGSDLAVQDVVDAIDYAVAQGGVDANRVYAVGYSGGGMMALLLAGRHPDRVSAVAAWGPPYDLIAFYRQSRSAGRHYAGNISAGCGGDPTESGPAQEECLLRSPMTYLDAAREQGVAVFIGQGFFDTLVSPTQGANAFNQLADPKDRLTSERVDEIGRHRVPEGHSGTITVATFFGEGDPAPVFARHSDLVWLVFVSSGHDMLYGPTARWFASDPH